MKEFKKPITEADLLLFLKEGRLQFPPLQTEPVVTKATPGAENRIVELATLLPLRWRSRTYHFVVEARRLWTPKAVAEAAETARRIAVPWGSHPLILVPYLSEERLLALEAEGVSGIDLCGNGVVIVPDELLILRTGFPNRFRWEGSIKNVYRKNSSIVARTFLLVPQIRSVNNALEEIKNRGGNVALGTVSKVCQRLEEDLVIEGGRGQAPWGPAPVPHRTGLLQPLRVGPSPSARWYHLLQPEKLLGLLAANYELPTVTRTFQGKWGLPQEALRVRLGGWQRQSGSRVVLTGASSVEAYAVMAREPVLSFYCTDIEKAVASLDDDLRETDRFANVILLETQDEFVYFDRRRGLVASPVQSFLELMHGDTRERETAGQVQQVILKQLAEAWQGEG